MDAETPGWRDDTVFLWDNAPYHKSAETKDTIAKLGVEVIYTGPYSYSAAPVELLFAALKFGELNPDCQPSGKR